MADAQDFIPNEADIDVQVAYFQDNVKNLAENEDILGPAVISVQDYEARFVGQRDTYIDESTGIWNQQDGYFRSGQNDAAVQGMKHNGANEPDVWERAKVGSTLFYRQVRQKASNAYAVLTSKDMPFKYQSLAEDEDSKPEIAEKRADTLNKLAKWSMKKDKFNRKSIEFLTQLGKNGNTPVLIEWIQRMGEKKVRIPRFDEDGITIAGYDTEIIQTVVENRPTMEILPIEGVMLDTAIGDVQRQECVIISSVVSMTTIINGISTGIYRKNLLENIGRAQQWDGFSGGFENEQEKKENRGMENKPTQTGTGQYLKREVFINLPIDEEKETWDELKNVPQRFRITMFGNTPHNTVVGRIERNQEPDDTIPLEMIHANPDDNDLIYHISDFEVIKSNMAAQTTLARQIIDNNTLVNKPPTIRERGAVDGNDFTFGPNANWVADTVNSIKEYSVRDVSQSSLLLLDHYEQDSNTANSIDKNMVGESFGARTSASEANSISGNSRRPNIVNIEYILDQFLGFYADRLKVNWEAYGRKDQVVQITDENDNLAFVRPTDIAGEYDIVIDIMDDIKDTAVEGQRMINYMQTVGGIQQLSQQQDWKMLAEDFSESIMGSSKYVIGASDGDASALAMANLQAILVNGVQPQMTPDMNLAKHLEIYKEGRLTWQGVEDQNPNVELLDQVIAQIENRIAQDAQAGGAQQQPQQQGAVPEAVQQGQVTSEALGGLQ